MDADLHLVSVALLAAAGLAFLTAAGLRWRLLGQPGPEGAAPRIGWWPGFALQSLALLVSLCDPGHPDFAYACLAGWAMVAALLFASRSVHAGVRGLFALPLGAVLVLVAAAGLLGQEDRPVGSRNLVVLVHALGMTAWLAAIIVAGAAGGLRLLAERQLRSRGSDGDRALRLPSLPTLDRLVERSVVIAGAALLAGVATGGAALKAASWHQRSGELLHPAMVSAVVALGLLAALLALRQLGRLSRRGEAIAALQLAALGAFGIVATVIKAHG